METGFEPELDNYEWQFTSECPRWFFTPLFVTKLTMMTLRPVRGYWGLPRRIRRRGGGKCFLYSASVCMELLSFPLFSQHRQRSGCGYITLSAVINKLCLLKVSCADQQQSLILCFSLLPILLGNNHLSDEWCSCEKEGWWRRLLLVLFSKEPKSETLSQFDLLNVILTMN